MLIDNVAQECEALLAKLPLVWGRHCTGFLDLPKAAMETSTIMLLLVWPKMRMSSIYGKEHLPATQESRSFSAESDQWRSKCQRVAC